MHRTTVTTKGLELTAEFDAMRVFDTWVAVLREVYLNGHEMFCIMDLSTIRDIELQIEKQIREGKCQI